MRECAAERNVALGPSPAAPHDRAHPSNDGDHGKAEVGVGEERRERAERAGQVGHDGGGVTWRGRTVRRGGWIPPHRWSLEGVMN